MKAISSLRTKGFSVTKILGGKTQIRHEKPFTANGHEAIYKENTKLYGVTLRGWFKTAVNVDIKL